MQTQTDAKLTEDFRKNLPGFFALVFTQAQGAFSDNLYRWIIVYWMLAQVDGDTAAKFTIIGIGVMVFAVSYLMCPGITGALADKFSKRTVIIGTKISEMTIMAFSFFAFSLDMPMVFWTVWFFMSLQSAFFGPAKLGILPEIMPETRLSWANGVMQLTLFVAMVSGTMLAGYFMFNDIEPATMSIALVALSALGFVMSWFVPKVPAANPAQTIPVNPWGGIGKHIGEFAANRVLMLTLVGGSFFWFIGAMAQQNAVAYSDLVWGNEQFSSMVQASMMIGIGIGSFAAGYLSRRKIELGLTSLGLLGMAVFSFLLGFDWEGQYTFMILIACFSFMGGIYEVPIDATLEHRSPRKERGGLIATWNIFTCIGILLAGAIFVAMGQLGLNPSHVFFATSGFSVLMIVYMVVRHPVYVLRSALWLLTSTVYRLRVIGRRNIPERGPALLVANHSSFFDALVLLASIDREVRFVISQEIYEVPWIRFLARFTGAIPVSAVGGPSKLAQSFHRATEALKNGEVVCIFAEGQVTRTGHILPFRKSLERITKGIDVPLVPVHIDRLWGTVINYTGHQFKWKLPNRLPYPILVNYGKVLPSSTPSWAVRTAVQELGTVADERQDRYNMLLHRSFIRAARRHPLRVAVADERSGPLKYAMTLIGAVVLARKLKPILGDEKMVGLLVPPSVGGAVVNVAILLMGKVPVNLNYTASNEIIANCAEQCGIKHTLTAKLFLQKLPSLKPPAEAVYLDDLRESVTKKDRIQGALIAFLTPAWLLERICGTQEPAKTDDLCTVIFSSGSSGDPKGIMLSHRNVASNITSAMQVFPHRNDDCIMGILPFFHSFGFTGTLWLPLSRGFTCVYHPSPLEAKNIGELVEKYRARFLIATPTFLQNYIRRVLPEQFESLVYVITGAEKLPDRIRKAFKSKFGVEPLEGYGCTECAPIVSVNIPDFRAPGYYRVGTKHGTIGHPLPGLSVRICDPDTGTPLTNGAAGLLQVKGPNVMQGYLGMEEKTKEVLKEGWYDTGDIARIDDDGFITITDRLSRFSKIAGEMVPHARVEEVLHSLLKLTDQAMAVAGVPDESKGERLVVLHTLDDDQLDELFVQMENCGLPNLWKPKASAFYRIDEMPLLGTGKLDLQAIKKTARAFDVGE